MPRNPVQFGTEPFTAAAPGKVEGIPDHAAMIEGRLIHLDTKNLKGWGVTAAAAKQIIAGIVGVPIRACNSPDPHACDYSSDNFANVGYAVNARIEDGWVVAGAAITDRAAVSKINDKTWLPFGKGGWSVTGYPSNPTADFDTSGLTNGFSPASIALIIGNGTPAFEGSGFEMVAAAITDHRGDNMTGNEPEGGGDPATYTQDALDKAIKEALDKQKTDDADAIKKAADAELAKQKTEATDALAKQKAEFDENIKKLSADEKVAYDAKIADMTSKDDMEKILAEHAKQTEAKTLDTIERQKLMTEYKDVMQKSPVAGAPFMTEGQFNPELFNAEMETIGGMQTAAIAGIVSKAKMVAAAVPGASAFDGMTIPGQAPGGDSQGAKDLASITELREATGRV